MAAPEKYVQHQKGVWEHKVNFIVHLKATYDDFSVREQIGTRKISPTELELCCLPFYIYGYSLGDILEIAPDTYDVIGIKKKSGRYLYRILFKCPVPDVVRIADQCKAEFGALFEWYNATFCAVDLATEEVATQFANLMRDLKSEGILDCEVASH